MPRGESIPIMAGRAYGLILYDWRQIGRVWRLETDRGVFALKQAPPPEDAHLLWQAEIHMRVHGFTRFPRRALTRGGEPYCELPQGECCSLHEWLSGTPPRLDLAHRRDLEILATAVAEFHLASLGFADRTHVCRTWHAWPIILASRMEDLRRFAIADGRGGRFARLYRQALPAAREEGRVSLRLIERSGCDDLACAAVEASGLCHGDLSPNNALISGNEAYLLDLDRAERTIFPHDLAVLLRRALAAQGWQPALAEVVVRAYMRVRPFSTCETRTLTAFLHWPQQMWRLGHQYFIERLDRPERFFLDRLWHWTNGTGARLAFLAYWRNNFW